MYPRGHGQRARIIGKRSLAIPVLDALFNSRWDATRPHETF